ncbi:MAG: addiction module toxin RelE [Okeania sp. SIO3C4]|nr:addiction module toxin RelE [Okeania sp. SIO3C4]
MASDEKIKPLFWIGDSLKNLREFPESVKDRIGFALYQGQAGSKHISAKPLKGLGGGIIEIVEDFDEDTYRAVYTVKLKGAIYVLHAFQKKSKKGIKTPQKDIELIKQRLKIAQLHFNESFINNQGNNHNERSNSSNCK